MKSQEIVKFCGQILTPPAPKKKRKKRTCTYLYVAGAPAGARVGRDGLGGAARVLQHVDDRGEVALVRQQGGRQQMQQQQRDQRRREQRGGGGGGEGGGERPARRQGFKASVATLAQVTEQQQQQQQQQQQHETATLALRVKCFMLPADVKKKVEKKAFWSYLHVCFCFLFLSFFSPLSEIKERRERKTGESRLMCPAAADTTTRMGERKRNAKQNTHTHTVSRI